MGRPPLTFNTIICLNCGAIVALVPPGALLHTTHIRCVYCKVTRTVEKPAERVLTTVPA